MQKTVVITGGSSGIGKAAALSFAKEGYKVLICGRRLEKLEETKTEFNNQGLELYYVQKDIFVPNALDELADEANKILGRIDVWVNNAAGLLSRKPFFEYSEDDFDYLVRCNMKSVFMGCRAAARIMMPQKSGVIISTSSMTGLIPSCGAALYGAIKASVDSFTKSFAGELAPYGIRVVGVQPAYVVTEMAAENIGLYKDFLESQVPLKRLAEPCDVAGVYTFLASDAASYLTGVSIPVSGGKGSVQNPMWPWEWADGQHRL